MKFKKYLVSLKNYSDWCSQNPDAGECFLHGVLLWALCLYTKQVFKFAEKDLRVVREEVLCK